MSTTLITPEDMIKRYGDKILIELTDRSDPRTGCIDDQVLECAIVDASAFVVSYLSSQYDIDTLYEQCPPPIGTYTMAIALFMLTNKPSAWIKQAYDTAVAWLVSAQKGDVVLGIGKSSGDPVAPSGHRIMYCSPGRTITQRHLSRYVGGAGGDPGRYDHGPDRNSQGDCK